MKKVVCFGGGNGMPKTVLRGLKDRADLSVVCAMLDSGGSSGRIRKDLKIVSPGDLRRSLLELSGLDNSIKKVLDYRFEKGELKGHNVGNLIIASFLLNGIDCNEFFKTKHRVIPATLDDVELCALLKNGRKIRGETSIDIPKHKSSIKKVYLSKKARAFPEALKAIKNADVFIIGPGDLYSSLLQIFLINDIKEAVRRSKAKIIYICNLMTKKGETEGFTVNDFVKEMEKYLGRKIDVVLCNNRKIDKKTGTYPKQVVVREEDDRFVCCDLIKKDSFEHDYNKVARKILSLI